MFVFKINNVDFTDCIKVNGGYKLKRTDFDDEEAAGRTLDVTMHRARLAQKRTCTFLTVMLPHARMNQLSNALKPETISVTYLDFDTGVTTKLFYGTDLEADAYGTINDVDYWKGSNFTLMEV